MTRSRDTTTGTSTMVRFLLRRDRLKLPLWVGGLGLYMVYIGTALPQLAPTPEDLAGAAILFDSPVGRMWVGPAFGMDAVTYERFFAGGYALYLHILAALMNILLVARHTRAEEQSGRAEVVRANVVGRHAPLTAALIVAAIANAAAAMVVAALGIANGYAAAGSMLVGVAMGLVGMAFAGVTAVTVQLSANSRAAAGLAGGVLGVAFLLRALGDMAAVGGSALSWASAGRRRPHPSCTTAGGPPACSHCSPRRPFPPRTCCRSGGTSGPACSRCEAAGWTRPRGSAPPSAWRRASSGARWWAGGRWLRPSA